MKVKVETGTEFVAGMVKVQKEFEEKSMSEQNRILRTQDQVLEDFGIFDPGYADLVYKRREAERIKKGLS